MDLNIHVPTGTLLADRKSLSQLAEAKVTQKNDFPVNVWFLGDGPDLSTPLVVIPIPSPYTRIVLSSRPNDDLDNADLLFFLDSFTAVGSGDTLHYTGTLNTTTAGVASLFTSESKTRAPALLDVDLLVTADPEDGRQTIVKQRDIWIYRAIWQGSEGVDPDASPAYPLPSEILTRSNAVTQAIPTGQDYVDVDISPLALTAAPSHCAATIRLPSPTADLIAAPAYSATSATLVRVLLSAAAPATGYNVTLLVIP